MAWLRSIVSRVRAFFNGRQLDQELDEELRFCLEMETEENIRRGMGPEDADLAARLKIGGPEQIKEICRDERGFPFLESLLRDLRYGVRSLGHTPGFAFVVVAILAIGIGANTAIFSLVDGGFLRPFPVANPDELMWIQHRSQEGRRTSCSYLDYEDLCAQTTAFSGIVAESRRGSILTTPGESELVFLNVVSPNYFNVLGLEPELGRTINPQLDHRSGDPSVVISYRLWNRRFQRDPHIVGKHIQLLDKSFPVVGVLPASFRGLKRMLSVDVWVAPVAWVALVEGNRSEFERRDSRQFLLLGRQNPGVQPAEIEAQLSTIAKRLEEANPGQDKGRTLTAMSERSQRRQRGVGLGLMLMPLAGLVLVIVCSNVANLSLSRVETRAREIAIRLAVGASRLRIMRQLFAESLLVACLGTGLGLFLAYGLIQVVPALMPPGLPLSPHLQIDQRVLAVTLAASLIALFLSGLMPALRGSTTDLTAVMKGGGVSIGRGSRWFSLRNFMAAGQIALCTVLVAVAVLFIRTMVNTGAIDPGFDARKPLILADVLLDGSAYQRGVLRVCDELAEDIEGLPGVKGVAFARRVHLSGSGGGATRRVSIPGKDLAPGQDKIRIKYNQVSPDYFKVMGTRILRGRCYDRFDREGSSRVVLINQTMANRFWPGEEPIGKHVMVEEIAHEIVGVTEDGKITRLREAPEPYLYFSFAQAPSGEPTFLVELDSYAAFQTDSLRQTLQRGEVGFSQVMTLEEHMQSAVFDERLPAQLAGGLAVVGMTLAAVGLYGVIALMINQRRREFGVRLALGAKPQGVLRLVLGQGFKLTIISIPIGVVLALTSGQLIASFLYGVTPADPLSLVLSALLVLIVALAATALPARKATHVDPAEILRYE
jgi:putative ABC transport system permease protein